MKVLMCPVISGCVVPWGPRNFWRRLGKIVWGVGLCPEGVLAESFSQNAMWPSLPHGAVGILRGCGNADSTRLRDAQRLDVLSVSDDWRYFWQSLYLMGRAADGLSCFGDKFCPLFYPSYTLSWVWKLILDTEVLTNSPQSKCSNPLWHNLQHQMEFEYRKVNMEEQ